MTDLVDIFIQGDKSNHIPVLHVPQIYYFLGFATVFGWPALISYDGGPLALARAIRQRMFGSARYAIFVRREDMPIEPRLDE